jgi:hypothetical protein
MKWQQGGFNQPACWSPSNALASSIAPSCGTSNPRRRFAAVSTLLSPISTANRARNLCEADAISGSALATHSVSPLGVNVSDVDLHRAVILGLDQAVGGAALARDVQIDGVAGSVL